MPPKCFQVVPIFLQRPDRQVYPRLFALLVNQLAMLFGGLNPCLAICTTYERHVKALPLNTFAQHGPYWLKMRKSDEVRWLVISTWKATNNIRKTARLTNGGRNILMNCTLRYRTTKSASCKAGRGRKRLVKGHVAEHGCSTTPAILRRWCS